jgi:thiamine biosynthesis lipoprotein
VLRIRSRLTGVSLSALLAVLAPPSGPGIGGEPLFSAPDSLFHQARPLMGTEAEIFLYAGAEPRALELFEAAFAEMRRVEEALSTYRPTSELSRINREAGNYAVTTDPEVFGLIRDALAFSGRAGGAFDITVGPLVRAWGFFRGSGRRPSEEDLAEARRRTGWEKVSLDPSARRVRFLVQGMELDMGGMGKGWALDRAGTVLRGLGVTEALLSLGHSSFLALGAPPERAGWLITLPDPDAPERILSRVPLRDRALSTSGSRQKYFDLDGRRYGHIIDPRSGMPTTEGVIQVSVTGNTAVGCDMLSTALFVLGPEKGRAVLEGEGTARALLVMAGTPENSLIPLNWPWETGG